MKYLYEAARDLFFVGMFCAILFLAWVVDSIIEWRRK